MEPYSIVIVWSVEYRMYFARVDELPGCIADGSSPEEALKNIGVVLQEWVETAKEEGRPIPRAWTLEDAVQREATVRSQMQEALMHAIQQADLQATRNPFGVHSGSRVSGTVNRVRQVKVRPAVA